MTKESTTLGRYRRWGLLAILLVTGGLVALFLAMGQGGSDRALAQGAGPPCPVPNPQPFPAAGCDRELSNAKHNVTIDGTAFNCILEGPTVIERGGVGDTKPVPGAPNGLDDIQTEIIFMKLTGLCQPGNIEVTMRESPTLDSKGHIEEQNDPIAAPGSYRILSFPANSFFDVFVEIETPLGTFHNQVPIRMFCKIPPGILPIPPVDCMYEAQNLPIPVFDDNDPKIERGEFITSAVHTLKPSPVGGIEVAPEVLGVTLETPDSSGPGSSLLAGVSAAVAAGAVTLGCAAWYARRRWLR